MADDPRCKRGHKISDWMDAYCPHCIRLGLEDVPPQFTGEHRERILRRCRREPEGHDDYDTEDDSPIPWD